MDENSIPLTIGSLISQLKKLPEDADIYFIGTISDKHCFTSIKAPVASVQGVKKYPNTERSYVTLYGFQND